MAWAFTIAVRKAAAVFGYFFSQVGVTMYPLMGTFWVVPSLESASGTAPIDSSVVGLTNGSGIHAASTWPEGQGCGHVRELDRGRSAPSQGHTALSASTELDQQGADVVLDVDGDPLVRELGDGGDAATCCGTMISWLPGCMMEPGARTRKSAWVLRLAVREDVGHVVPHRDVAAGPRAGWRWRSPRWWPAGS